MARKEETVERGPGYRIYYNDGLFWVDLYKPIIHSYETLRGAKEAVYYAGLRDTKE